MTWSMRVVAGTSGREGGSTHWAESLEPVREELVRLGMYFRDLVRTGHDEGEEHQGSDERLQHDAQRIRISLLLGFELSGADKNVKERQM
jgi:hypothetical protein